MIFSDGDSQEITQLDNALRKFMPNIYRGRFCWYIVDRGWHNNAAGITSFPIEHSGFYQEIFYLIKNWIYSWMKDSCETQDEYNM